MRKTRELAVFPGTAFYGNIGAADRLDFTVIGPAGEIPVSRDRSCRKGTERHRLAAVYFAASLHPTNYMHRFCHRPIAAHSQMQNRKALNVLRCVGIFDTAALPLTALGGHPNALSQCLL